jgi:hypothetical protein
MATMNEGQVIEVKPAPDVYTVLLGVIVAVLTISVTLSMVKLMKPVEKGGYGLPFKAVFVGEDAMDGLKK